VADVPQRLIAALQDRYRLERELGQGGMATVYLAADLKHDRKVAIKVLKPDLAAVLGAERFIAEIKTTAALSHPHILPLFDSGEAGGFLYYVMPYIEGETIREKLTREGQFGIEEALRITTEVADALDYAHRHGVIHRDIKPENILLHDGRPMVMDFGIALAVSAAAGGRMTETGLSLGTPHYMSPEQATADKQITARSDVYSLASVLYEMLAGEPPHSGGSAQAIILKIVTDVPRPVSELRKSVPPNVVAALAKALEKVPADRFESARALGEALRNQAFTTTAMPGVVRAPKGTRWRLPLLSGLLLGLAAGGAGMALLRPPAAARGEINREQLTFSGQAATPAISPDGRRVAYVVDACTPAQVDCRVALEVLEIGGTRAQVLIPSAQFLGYPRWSHDGESVVVGGVLDEGRAGVFAIPRLNATPRLIHEGAWAAYDTHPRADSVLVLARTDSVMSVIGLADGAVHGTFPVSLTTASDIAWSPTGERIAASDANGLHVLDRDGATLGTFTGGAARRWVRWSTGGEALLYFRTGRAREDELVRREVSRAGALSDQAEVIMPRTPTLYEGEFDVARETGAVVIRTGDAITDLWSFELDQRPVATRRETHGTTWYGTPVASEDGRHLYYYRGDALGDNIYRLDRATGAEEALTAESGPGANAVTLSADGARLAYGRVTEGGMVLQSLDLASRRVSTMGAPIWARVAPVTPRGFLAGSLTGALVFLDSLGGSAQPSTDPDSLVVGPFAVAPDGLTVVFAGFHPPAGGAPPAFFIGRMPIRGGPLTLLTTLPAPFRSWPAVSIALDGTIFLGQWVPGEEQPSLWRLPAGGGSLARVADLSVACAPTSLVVGWSGRIATCNADDFRGDAWVVDLGRATR